MPSTDSRPFRRRRQLNFRVILGVLLFGIIYLAFMQLIEPISIPTWINEDPAAQQLLANSLARTSVTLISTVFACLFLAIPLTANMYTPQLINIFVTSPTNRIMLGLFVFSAAHAVWVSRVAGSSPVPRIHLVSSLFLVMLTLVLILPYLFSVFRFLEPSAIISRVSGIVKRGMCTRVHGNSGKQKQEMTQGIRNLGNIILRALERSDRDVATSGVEALEHCAEVYLKEKRKHPADWFQVNATHFSGLSQETIRMVNGHRTWVENELLLQLSRSYSAALAKVPDVISAISRALRHFAVSAASNNDQGPLELSLRYFNNFLREAIKKQDIHAVYDLLHQYRQLAEQLWDKYPERVLKISRLLAYYGQMAANTGLSFAHDLIVYDLGHVVTRVSHENKNFGQLLERFLNIPQITNGSDGPPLTIGMFKARLITAALLVEKGLTQAAQKIEKGLTNLPADLMAKAENQLLGDVDEFFWEVTDRQRNLDYVPPKTRATIRTILTRLYAS